MPELKDFEDNKNPRCQHSLTTRIFVFGLSLLSKNVYYVFLLFHGTINVIMYII